MHSPLTLARLEFTVTWAAQHPHMVNIRRPTSSGLMFFLYLCDAHRRLDLRSK